MGTFAIVPYLRLIAEGVAPGGHFDPSILARVLSAPRTWLATERTLATALASMVIAVLLGGALALLVGITDLPGKRALAFAAVLPIMIPSQVTAIAWINLLDPSSPLLHLLDLAPATGTANPLYGFGGISLLMGLEHAPLVFLALRAGLANLPGEAIEAAEAAGAKRGRILRTVVLPMSMPALAAGAALAFVSALGNFGTPALLGIPAGYSVLTVLIYQQLAGFGPQAISEIAVLSLLLGAIAVLGLVVQGLIGARRIVRWARPPTRRLLPLRNWRWPLAILAWAILGVTVVMPLAALAATALVPAYGVPLSPGTITAENFRYLAQDAATARAAFNSLFLAITTALVLALVSVALGYIVVWRQSPIARLLNLAAELPYALPGVVLALAAILVFIHPLPLIGISLYGTLGIILVAYFARFLVLALRTTTAGYLQIDRALEDAAAISGASLWRRLRTILLPMAAPAVAAGAILVFLIALNELTVSALLWSSGHETLGVVVFSLEQGGDATLAAALSLLVVLATVLLMGIASLVARRLPRGVLPWQG
ncbi:MAG TPA: iron ABC transporter permease [Stellaceae bacterium]|nr:iron ABC transporter permease [Stellaceae bacterium]